MNDENLKKGKATQFKSGEKQASISRKGGIASGEAKRKAKSLREYAELVAKTPLTEQGIQRFKRQGVKVDKIDSKDLNALMGVVFGQYVAAMNGSKPSADFIKELMEGKQAEESSAQSFIDALNDKADTLESAGDDVEE